MITTLVVAPLTLLNMVSICRPLQDAKRLADSIAKGDLTEQLNVVGTGRSLRPAKCLEDHAKQSQWHGGACARCQWQYCAGQPEIATGNGDLLARTEQTASNLQQTVASLLQLTGTVQQTASSAQMANQLSASASQTATQGGLVVEQAVRSMRQFCVQPQDWRHHRLD